MIHLKRKKKFTNLLIYKILFMDLFYKKLRKVAENELALLLEKYTINSENYKIIDRKSKKEYHSIMYDISLKNGLVIHLSYFGLMGVSTNFYHISNKFATYSFEDLVESDLFDDNLKSMDLLEIKYREYAMM